MAAYRDPADWVRGGVRCGHLVADSLDELHDCAARIGLSPTQFQRYALTPHYTLPAHLHATADALGVRALDRASFTAQVACLNTGGDPRPPVRTKRGRTKSGKAARRTPPSRPVRTPEQPALL